MSRAAAGRRLGHVWLVGAGPGDPGLITRAGLDVLRAAEVVVFDRLAAPELLEEAPATALCIDAGKAPGDARMTQEEINAALVEHGLAGRRVVRLKGGDPFIFGRGGEEALALVAAGVPCTVIPGVTSAAAGPAVAGIPLTHRGVAASFIVVTGHEDPRRESPAVDWPRVAQAADTVVVLMGAARLDAIARALIEGGRDAATPAVVVERASTSEQRTVRATLEGIAEAAASAEVGPPAVLIVGEVATLEQQLAPPQLAPLAGLRVLVTRTRAQSSTLIDALRREGALPVELPALELQRVADADAVDAAVEGLRAAAYGWTVFTSANAVEVWWDLLVEREADARAFAGTMLCAIGPATAAALASRGLRADLVANAAVGESLAEAILSAPGAGRPSSGGRVLLPRAEGARDVIPKALESAGLSVDEVTLYIASPPAAAPPEALDLIRRGAVDVVTFTSSSTVRNLVALLGDDVQHLREATVACIGPVTAVAATEAGMSPDVVAEEHTIAGLVEALRAHLWQSRLE